MSKLQRINASPIFTIVRTVGYTLAIAYVAWKGDFMIAWGVFFLWGVLMAVWEVPTHHWHKSIMKHFNWSRQDWDMNESWKRLGKWGKITFPWDDAFHISKSLSIIILCQLTTQELNLSIFEALSLGWLTTESFNLFYKVIFIKHDTK